MAYKKYIKKDGKIYGPYIYHSKRVDGKVVTEYKGTTKLDAKKVLLFMGIFIALVFVGFAGYVFVNNFEKGSITGFSVLNLDADYQKGEILQGELKLFLNEGELLPASSKLVFETSNSSYSYALQDILSEKQVQGNFYMLGSNLSGEGIGYGLIGEKETFPNVFFALLISSLGENDTVIEKEVKGSVSKNEPFTYALKGNETAEIKPLSVKNSTGGNLPDTTINLMGNGSEARVTTNYSQTEKGFGEGFVGDVSKDFLIDVSNLNMSFNEGNLRVRLEYLGENLESLSAQLQQGVVDAKSESVDNVQDLSKDENKSEIKGDESGDEKIVSEPLSLTLKEREILENEFGNITIEVTEAVVKNDFLVVRYEIGNYWVEHTYPEDLSNETLDRFMEEDKIKWLKDIAYELSKEGTDETNLGGFLGEYDF